MVADVVVRSIIQIGSRGEAALEVAQLILGQVARADGIAPVPAPEPHMMGWRG